MTPDETGVFEYPGRRSTHAPFTLKECDMHYLRVRTLGLVLLCFVTLTARAQTPEELKITSVQLDTIAEELVVEVQFSAGLDPGHKEDRNKFNVSVHTLPSNANLRVREVTTVIAAPNRLQIFFDAEQAAPASTETKIKVCFTSLHFIAADNTPSIASNVCSEGLILNAANVDAEKERALKVFSETEKTEEERNIFASGFVTNGEGGDAEGGAEINLNSNDLGVRGLTAFMRLKKATADEADPKHLEIGINQSTTNLLDKAGLRKLAEYYDTIRDPSATADEKNQARKNANELLKNRQKRLLGGMFFDFGGKIETEALTFDVTNVIGEGAFQIQSRTKRLFGSNKGFWRFRLMPAATELGYNVSQQPPAGSEAAAIDPDWLARFKFGGVFTLFYKNHSEGPALFRRVQLDVQAVDRYLFRREVQFDKEKMTNTTTDRGNKGWLQADFKVYFTDPEEGSGGLRSGFKLSYNRGSLPPVFANTKSFQFGFVLESTETKK